MATAIKHHKVSITLELDEDEAQVLRDVCDMIGGLSSSRRGLMDQIKEALVYADIDPTDKADVCPKNQAIYFTA